MQRLATFENVVLLQGFITCVEIKFSLNFMCCIKNVHNKIIPLNHVFIIRKRTS